MQAAGAPPALRYAHEVSAFNPLRRRLMLSSLALPLLPGLPGCVAPLPVSNQGTARGAQSLLADSATAHGLAAFSQLSDVNVSYGGRWRGFVDKLQPALVDVQYRGGSQERLLLRDGIVAQAHAGPAGRKQVFRRSAAHSTGEVRVWRNGAEAADTDSRAAAALVADGYSLFLMGPLLLVRCWTADRVLAMEMAGTENLEWSGGRHPCDILRIRIEPGLGFSASEQLAIYIDREERLMRRVRFTLGGLESTRGAVAEVDTFDHVTLYGIKWPTRFHERLLRPLILPVHDWHMTGLDVNRDLTPADVSAKWSERALRAAGTAPP